MPYEGEDGFTLIELILVVVILGIVAGIAIPSIHSLMDETYLDGGVEEIAAALRYARSTALKDDTTILVDFDPLLDKCSLLKGYSSSGNNTLTFDNTKNPPQSETWGVRNVKVLDGVSLLFEDKNPYGNIPGGDTSHVDKMDYNFTGTGQHIKLFFSLYDADTEDEVKIYLNGSEVASGGKGSNNGWTKTKGISLPPIITGDASILNNVDKKPYVVDLQNSLYFPGVDIVSATFGSSDDVLFYEDGSPSAGGTVVLSYRGRTKSIVVEPDTGRIVIQ